MFTSLLTTLFELCRFRLAPQALPGSRGFTYLMVSAYFLVGLLVSSVDQGMRGALITTAVDTLLICLLAAVSLWVAQKPERIPQTLSALTGAGVLLGLIGWPIMYWLHTAAQAQTVAEQAATIAEQTQTGTVLPATLVMALIIWNIAIIGHILRHALEVTFGVAIGIALLYMYMSLRLMGVLFVATN